MSPAASTRQAISSRAALIALVTILLVAAILRLAALTAVPPGLNQDEASNAWNGYCLLQTGKDQHGTPWPIFYARCLGGNRSTLYLYLLFPFQWLGGLNVWTTRLPSAVGGIATVWLCFWLGSRLFGRPVGLVAAALLALNPWHIQQSRWGHEAGMVPLLVTVSLAATVWAGVPITGDPAGKPRPIRAALAGLVSGIACYGYPAVRMFVPLFLVVLGVLNIRHGWRAVRASPGATALAFWIISLGATLGPLAWKQLTDHENISKRAVNAWVWGADDPILTRVQKAANRYLAHYSPDFLFIRGDPYEIQSPPGMGQFQWYVLPPLLIGTIVVLLRSWRWWPARLLLLWLMLYPAGDTLLGAYKAVGAHALRSLPGVVGILLVVAVGGVAGGRFLWRWSRGVAKLAAVAAVIIVLALHVRFARAFFVEYPQKPSIYHQYHADLVEACEWLNPRLANAAAVFVTTRSFNQPYVVTLVALGYDPAAWFAEKPDVIRGQYWDVYRRYGKLHFMYDQSWRETVIRLQENDAEDLVYFVARPDEGLGPPVHEIRRPNGDVVLWILEARL